VHTVVRWGHLLLPYIPVFLTLVLFVSQMARAVRIDSVETYVEIAVIVLLVVRQGVTLVQNAWLLERVSEGQRRLTHQAFHDALTGLANRALFRDRLDHALALHQLDGGRLAVLFLDLDDFKQVNDHHGHAVGDRLLKAAGDRLRAGVRGGDTVARLGGDEFAVLLEGPGDAGEIAQQLLDALRRPYQIDGRTVTVGASIGFVEAGDTSSSTEAQVHHLDTAESLVRRADAAMYAGKRRGKNTLVRYHLDLADETGTSDLSQLLAAALSGGRGLDVHYQPIVRLSDGAVIAVEALARWTDPVLGPVPPDLFITTAERVGLVGLVDEFVLNRACRDAAAFHGSWSDVVVHVNISAARLGQPDQEKGVLDALRVHSLPPRRLLLELTETARLQDLAVAADAAARLTAYGVLLALDDFGTGYNALAQLHALPVDVVKLDRSFVTSGTGRSAAMCRSIVSICDQMGVKVIAEGIETSRQATTMAALGCGYGQGHRFGRPGPLSSIAPGDALADPVTPAPQPR
jgi:diguanylate cyclase (GGDEF)-like protein